ncbi:hypothetical protein TI39_contig4167g00001 [Zymoseptoria brevis]|uniref:Apple domain-containing protein n=1 Tax=Zymoseptoria brevis TaxID=1047168 RepID=A0A0F4GBA6_9PEZI|nr:hypothetical protein TI39_contig4167g00001 [Zymoseptoria brevis]
MHFLKALVGVTALLSKSAVGANIPSSDVEARSNLEARTYPSSVDQCKKDLKSNRNFEFCSAFPPPRTVLVNKTVIVKKGVKTICTTRTAACTTAKRYGKRDASPEIDSNIGSEALLAKRDAYASPEADAEAYYGKYTQCRRQGIPPKLQKYPCDTIKEACRAYFKPQTQTQTITHTTYQPTRTVHEYKIVTPTWKATTTSSRTTTTTTTTTRQTTTATSRTSTTTSTSFTATCLGDNAGCNTLDTIFSGDPCCQGFSCQPNTKPTKLRRDDNDGRCLRITPSTSSTGVTFTTSTMTATTSTAPSAMPTSCSARVNSPSSLSCGIKGKRGNDRKLLKSFRDSEYLTPDACALACAQRSLCETFYVTDGDPTYIQICSLYQGIPADQQFQADETSYYSARENSQIYLAYAASQIGTGSDPTKAQRYRSNGITLVDRVDQLWSVGDNAARPYIFVEIPRNYPDSGHRTLTCSLNDGLLGCTDTNNNARNVFQYCTNLGNALLLTEASFNTGSCTAYTFAAVDPLEVCNPPRTTTTTSTAAPTTTTSTASSTTASTTVSTGLSCPSNKPFTVSAYNLQNIPDGAPGATGPGQTYHPFGFATGNTATVLQLDSSCNVIAVATGEIMYTLVRDPPSSTPQQVYFGATYAHVNAVCNIVPGTDSGRSFFELQCVFGSNTGKVFAADSAGNLYSSSSDTVAPIRVEVNYRSTMTTTTGTATTDTTTAATSACATQFILQSDDKRFITNRDALYGDEVGLTPDIGSATTYKLDGTKLVDSLARAWTIPRGAVTINAKTADKVKNNLYVTCTVNDGKLDCSPDGIPARNVLQYCPDGFGNKLLIRDQYHATGCTEVRLTAVSRCDAATTPTAAPTCRSSYYSGYFINCGFEYQYTGQPGDTNTNVLGFVHNLPDAQSCAVSCSQMQGCKSFNYYRVASGSFSAQDCQLLSTNNSPTSINGRARLMKLVIQVRT